MSSRGLAAARSIRRQAVRSFVTENNKQQQRQDILKVRDALSPEDVAQRSHAVVEHVLKLPVVQRAQAVGLYASFRNEVRTERIGGWAMEQGKRVAYPRVVLEGDPLQYYRVEHLSDLMEGRWSIMEPPSTQEALSLDALDVIFLPGVVFDKQGRRLGFGHGYFDRTLEKYAGTKIGIAYDFQVIDTISPQEHDVPCDVIVTESQVYQLKS